MQQRRPGARHVLVGRKLFARFDAALRDRGYLAMSAQIIDATAAPAFKIAFARKLGVVLYGMWLPPTFAGGALAA